MEPQTNGTPHHRTMVALDIERSTTRPDPVKAELRNKLYDLFDVALRSSGIEKRYRDPFIDRGDGILALIHPVDKAPKALLLSRHQVAEPRRCTRKDAIAIRHALRNSQRRSPPAPDRRRDRRARPLPPRKPGRAHHPLRLSPVPVSQRPQPPARPLPVVDPQGRSQDRHPDAQPRPARAVPSPVRQHQTPARADQGTRDAVCGSRRASRRMDSNMRQLRPSHQLQRRHTPDITCPRRGRESAAFTAKTPRFGLQITEDKSTCRGGHPDEVSITESERLRASHRTERRLFTQRATLTNSRSRSSRRRLGRPEGFRCELGVNHSHGASIYSAGRVLRAP